MTEVETNWPRLEQIDLQHIYQTLKTVLEHISKHPKVCQKYSAMCGSLYMFSKTITCTSRTELLWLTIDINIWKIIYLNCKERYQDMTDHQSYTRNLSSCQIKTWKRLGPNFFQALILQPVYIAISKKVVLVIHDAWSMFHSPQCIMGASLV